MKVIIITGASSGIGFNAARILASRGHKVYAMARRMDRMEPLREFGVVPVSLDVTSQESAEAAVAMVLEAEGRIDVLVNNAGYGSLGPIECVSLEEAQRQLDVNLVGVARMTRLVLPSMRAQGSGRIVNISSVAGKVAIYLGGWYNASKFGIEAISDSLRMEVEPFGIKVSLIEPGGVFSNWGLIAADNIRCSSRSTPYEKNAEGMADAFSVMYGDNPLSLMTLPEKAADYIRRAVEDRRPRVRYTFGLGSGTLRFFHAVLPARTFDSIQRRFFSSGAVRKFLKRFS